MFGMWTFRFLNVERECCDPGFWTPARTNRLWLYNLHYFDDLNASDSNEREAWHRDLVHRWIADNPAVLAPGWEPYPTSLRIVNWTKWHFRGKALDTRALQSLAVQARALSGQVEYWLGCTNHLMANATALLFAGCLFSGGEGEQWIRRGARLLGGQIRSQVLLDGGHNERSPMYHAAVLQNLLDALNVLRTIDTTHMVYLQNDLLECARRMLVWLESMCHPDGGISFFHDAALDVVPTLTDLKAYACRLGIECLAKTRSERPQLTWLRASGYVRLETHRVVAIADVGSAGPDEQPGHSHACALSFELSLDKERIFVNSGTSIYEAGIERARQRGSSAHNTACVDGLDSSEMWGAFRVARSARVSVEYTAPGETAEVVAYHDGYVRLGLGIIHRRRFRLMENQLEIDDQFDGKGVHEYVVALHVGPRFRAVVGVDGCVQIVRRDGSVAASVETQSAKPTVEASTYHPEFGLSVSNQKIVARERGEAPTVIRQTIRWT